LSLLQRLRRLIDQADSGLTARQTTIHAALVLLGLAVITALGAVAWPIVTEPRPEFTAATDPRPAYVNRVREKIQKATQATLAALPQPAGVGSLVVRVEVAPDGMLLSAAIGETSGLRALDDLALRIVRSAAPFEPFPPEARKSTRVIEINSEFVFR
jgi:TonB family protein